MPRNGWIALAAAASLIALLAVLWTAPRERHSETQAVRTARPTTALPPGPVEAATAPDKATHRPSPVAPAARGAVPTPGVFDFGSMTPPRRTPPHDDAERFATNERFTQDDLRHPERYFDAAERMPELNRPEERRAVLEYFLAYRDKLVGDLERQGASDEERGELHATLQRYDAAIARLRALIGAQPE